MGHSYHGLVMLSICEHSYAHSNTHAQAHLSVEVSQKAVIQ